MKLNAYTLAVLVLVLLFGGISFSSVMDWWQTETTKEPAKFSEGELAGQYNPADIRGSYTFGDVSRLFEVSLADLQAAFRLPAEGDPAAYKMKDLESFSEDLPVEVGTASVRMFVAFYKGLPYDLEGTEETYLFPEAVAVLEAQGKMTPDQAAYLAAHLAPAAGNLPAAVELPAAGGVTTPAEATQAAPAPTQASEAQLAPTVTEHANSDRLVNGQTTFQDLLSWGLTQETIEQVLGNEMPAPLTKIKDYAAQKGQEFSGLKTTFQAEVDKPR